MTIIYDCFKELEDNLNNEKKFLSLVQEFINNIGIEDTLKALKATGISVDAYNTSKYNSLFNSVISVFKDNITSEKYTRLINEFITQSNTMTLLFKDYYSREEFTYLKNIPDKYKLFSFLIIFEIVLRIQKDKKYNKGINSKDSPFVIDIFKNIANNPKALEKLSDQQFTSNMDYIMSSSSKVLQNLLFYNTFYNNKKNLSLCSEEEEIDLINIGLSFNHMISIDVRTVLFDILEEWKFSNFTFKQQDSHISITPIEKRDWLAKHIAISRFESYRITQSITSVKESLPPVDENTTQLLPNAALNNSEKGSGQLCKDLFYSSNLSEKCNGVPIKEWLRAYAVISKISEDFLSKESFPDKFRLVDWVIVISQEDLEKKFVQYGISHKNAKTILNFFIFTKHSIDLMDSPCIKINDKLIIIPSLASVIDGASAFSSLMTRNSIDVSFKGKNFEHYLLQKLSAVKIEAKSIEVNHNNEIYQCDLMFLLDNNLFICECKNYVQPKTQRSFFEFNNKQQQDVKQLKRIANFYTNNLIHVSNAFCKDSNWKPKNIYNLLIYSCKLGEFKISDDVYITDVSIFNSGITQTPPQILDAKGIIILIPKKLKHVFQGKLTLHKFLTLIQEPYQIEAQKARITETSNKMNINSLLLTYNSVLKKFDDYYYIPPQEHITN